MLRVFLVFMDKCHFFALLTALLFLNPVQTGYEKNVWIWGFLREKKGRNSCFI